MVGCGDLGSRIATGLLALGNRITTLTRRPLVTVLPVRSLQGDVLQPDALAGLNEPVDQLVYCLTPSARDPQSYAAIYVDGLADLLAQFGGQKPPAVNFVSSTSVYGDDLGRWVSEDSPCDPERFNGRILLQAENLARSTETHRIFRLGGIYGPGRTHLIEQVRERRVPAPGPVRWTNRIHVEDAAAAICHLMSREHIGTFNIVDSCPTADHDVQVWLATRLGVPTAETESRSPEIRGRRISNRRLLATGYELRYPGFREGYAAVIETMGFTDSSAFRA